MRRSWIIMTLICFIFSGSLTAFGNETKGTMEEYQKQAEAKLEKIKEKVADLKSKAADLKEDSREKFNQEMKELKVKQEAAYNKLKELKSAGAKTWEKTKSEMDA